MTAQERKAEERNARRQRIQRAAREVFDDKGYARASIEQIARRANLSVGAIYLYFKSKDDLYLSLLADVLTTLEGELGRLGRDSDGRDPGRELGAAWERVVAWAETHLESARALRQLSQPHLAAQLSDEVIVETATALASIKERLATLVAALGHGEERAVELASVLWMGLLGALSHHDVAINLGHPASLRALALPIADLVGATRHSTSIANAA